MAIAFAKKDKPSYFRYIFIFIILGLLLSINAITNHNFAWLFNMKIPILIEQLLFLFQSLMLGLFFWEILKNSVFAKRIKPLLFLLILIQIILIIVVHSANTEMRPTIVPNLILPIFCFFYFKDLMNNKPTLILVKSSAFWIIIGILYYCCIGFPIYSLFAFIPKNQEYLDLRSQIFSITNMSLIVLYLFIIKSYLCLKHPQNL